MTKALKYQYLIDEKGLGHICPETSAIGLEIKAFRWCISPLEDGDNFLPKFEEEKYRNKPPRFNDRDDITRCSCCALSMYKSVRFAKDLFSNFPQRVRQLLQYTHVAGGVLKEDMGVVKTEYNNQHIDFFEYNGIELRDHFTIEDTL